MPKTAEKSFDPRGLLAVPAHGVTTLADPLIPAAWTRAGLRYGPWTQQLFQHPPRPDDVKQGDIGDCYVLSGLMAMLARPDGPEAIVRAMFDEGNDVVIRLFKGDAWHHVRVRKHLLNDTSWRQTSRSNRKDNWVRIVEKAWAAFFHGSYQGMLAQRGGTSAAIFDAFVGGSQRILLQRATAADRVDDLARVYTGMDGTQQQIAALETKVAALFTIVDAHGQADATAVAAGERLLRIWKAWNTRARSRELVKYCDNQAGVPFERRLVELGSGLDGEVTAALLAWANTHRPFPGVVGSGIYNESQREIFGRVARAIATQHAVSAITKERLHGQGENARAEVELQGLLSMHVYAVFDTKEEPVAPGSTTKLLFLGVRNPWGKTSRGYKRSWSGALKRSAAGALIGTKQSAAECWIELTDFLLNFETNFDISAEILSPARREFLGGGYGPTLAEDLLAQSKKLRRVLPGE